MAHVAQRKNANKDMIKQNTKSRGRRRLVAVPLHHVRRREDPVPHDGAAPLFDGLARVISELRPPEHQRVGPRLDVSEVAI